LADSYQVHVKARFPEAQLVKEDRSPEITGRFHLQF